MEQDSVAFMDGFNKLGIPTPPIIIAENKARDRYEIIDGQQRTKSMLKLRDDIEFQQRMKIKDIDKLKQLIDKYPLVVYSLRQAEGLDEERLEFTGTWSRKHLKD